MTKPNLLKLSAFSLLVAAGVASGCGSTKEVWVPDPEEMAGAGPDGTAGSSSAGKAGSASAAGESGTAGEPATEGGSAGVEEGGATGGTGGSGTAGTSGTAGSSGSSGSSGNGSSSSGSSVSSGVPADTAVPALTQEQQESICFAQHDYIISKIGSAEFFASGMGRLMRWALQTRRSRVAARLPKTCA